MLIPNSTSLRPHYFPYMTIFLTLSLSNKSLASVFLIYLPPLLLSTTPSCSIVFLSGSAFPLSLSLSLSLYTGSLHISYPAHPYPYPTPFSFIHSYAQFFSIFIPPLLALSSVLLLYFTSYMLKIHNCSYPLFLKFLICHKQPSIHHTLISDLHDF